MSQDLILIPAGGGTPGGNSGDHQYNNAGAFGGFADGTSTQVLHGGRTFSAVSLTQDVSGTLPLANGGTNADLSASGSATAFLAQDASHVISARSLVAADFPNPTSSGIGGVFAGFGAMGMLPGSQASGTIVSANNQVRYLRFYIPSKLTITKARTAGGATAGTGDFGIYSADGTTRFASLGATTYSNNTFTTTTISQTSVTLNPGWYIFAWTLSDSTKTHFELPVNSHSNMNQYGTCATAASAGALPSSLGALTPVTGSSVNIPVVWFEP